jgi:tetratricopeptide (TPR) repeat protein
LFKEETIRWKKKRKKRAIFIVVALFLSGLLYLLIGGPGSNYFKISLNRLLNPVPAFKHIIIEHNGEKKRLTPGQILHIHPSDSLKIVKISTSILFNKGIRLYSQSFDVNALQTQTVVTKLLPNQDMFRHYTYTITIKHSNNKIGEVGLVIAPSLEDWLTKANRIIDPQKRINFLQTAYKEEKGNFQIKMRLADEYLAQKRWEEGAHIIESILKEKEDMPAPIISGKVRLNLMKKVLDAYEHLHYYNKAVATLKKVLINSPEDLDLRLRLAELLEKKGRLKEAVEQYTIILPQLTRNEKIVYMKNIGYLLFQTSQKNKALQWYLKAAKYDKKDPNLYYNIGSIYDDLGKPKLAEEYLRLALELKKDDIEGRLRLGQSLFNKNKLTEAKRYVNEILKKNPHDLEALILLANIAEKEGDKEALRNIYKQIVSHDPKNRIILFNLGVLETEQGNLQKGLHYFERLVTVDPKDAQAREALFDIYQRQKRNDLAFNQAVQLIKFFPKKIAYYSYIFNHLTALDEFEQLAHYMIQGVAENPKNFELRQYLILVYLKLKKNELAVKEIKEALKLRPNNTNLLHQLAKIHEGTGNLDLALQAYKKILDISPDDEKAWKAYLKLRLKLLDKGEKSLQE